MRPPAFAEASSDRPGGFGTRPERAFHHLLCLKQAPLLNRPEQVRMPPFRQTQKPFWRIR